jgi:hypothetical protein
MLVEYNTKEGLLAEAGRPEETDQTTEVKEIRIMNALNVLYRDLTCAAASLAITIVLGLSFVQSTAVTPGEHAASTPTVSLQMAPVWFGQPQPAVLVD